MPSTGPENIPPTLAGLAIELDGLRPDPANARAHSARNLEAIAASLARFGQQRPILIDASGVIVAGNATPAAAKSLGWKRIAAITTALAGPDRTAYALADNRTAELASWDEQTFAALLTDLKAQDANAVAATGFSDGELGAILDGQATPSPDADDIPEAPDKA